MREQMRKFQISDVWFPLFLVVCFVLLGISVRDTFYTFRVSEPYPVTVDYGKSFGEMVSVGKYDHKNRDVNSKNFSIKGEGLMNVNLRLIQCSPRFDGFSSTVKLLEEKGMRLATIEELLAFGSTYPEMQRKFTIICLNSSWFDHEGDRYVPCLLGRSYTRVLTLCITAYGWGEKSRFLVVRL